MDEAFRTFENFYLSSLRFPQLFGFPQDLEVSVKKLDEIQESGFCFPLSNRDELGRKILFVNFEKLDTEKFSILDGMRLLTYVLMILVEEEETQIAGIVTIFNCRGASLKQFPSAKLFSNLMFSAKHATIARQGGNIFVNMPPFVSTLIEFARDNFLSEKLKSRLHIVKDFNELKTFVNPKLLPKERGGFKPEADMIQDFTMLRKQKLNNFKAVLNFKLDPTKVPAERLWSDGCEDTVGSFRLMEID